MDPNLAGKALVERADRRVASVTAMSAAVAHDIGLGCVLTQPPVNDLARKALAYMRLQALAAEGHAAARLALMRKTPSGVTLYTPALRQGGGVETWLAAWYDLIHPSLKTRICITDPSPDMQILARWRAMGAEITLSETEVPSETAVYWADMAPPAVRRIYVNHGGSEWSAKNARRAAQDGAVVVHVSRFASEKTGVGGRVIPNPVRKPQIDPAKAARIRQSWQPGRRRVALYIGRVVPDKNVHLFCEAALSADCLPVVVGVKAYEFQTDYVRGLRDIGALICGVTDDAANAMAAADVVVSVPQHEGFGYVWAEAMAAGVPLVANALGLIHDLMQQYGKAPCVLVSADTADIAGGIRRALAEGPVRDARGMVLEYADAGAWQRSMTTLCLD